MKLSCAVRCINLADSGKNSYKKKFFCKIRHYIREKLYSNRPAMYSNAFGEFSYQSVKPALFFGFRQMPMPQPMSQGSYLIAFPEKAILDLLYLYPQYNTAEAMLELRFDEWWMQEELDRVRLLDFAAKSGVKSLQSRVKLLLKTYLDD